MTKDKLNTISNLIDQDWSFETWQKRALFLCKRGNIETELLLKSYIHSLNPMLAIENKEKIHLIEQFFLESEQDLFNWLLNSHQTNQNKQIIEVIPAPEPYHQLIREIRDNYLK